MNQKRKKKLLNLRSGSSCNENGFAKGNDKRRIYVNSETFGASMRQSRTRLPFCQTPLGTKASNIRYRNTTNSHFQQGLHILQMIQVKNNKCQWFRHKSFVLSTLIVGVKVDLDNSRRKHGQVEKDIKNWRVCFGQVHELYCPLSSGKISHWTNNLSDWYTSIVKRPNANKCKSQDKSTTS